MTVSLRLLDLPRIGVATVVTAAIGLGLAAAFLQHSRSTPHVGPTSATLDDAFSILFGAAVGLALGGVLGALLVRRGSRVLSGVLVGLLAYTFVFAPVLVATDDISLAEDLNASGLAFLALLAMPLGASAAVGAIVGDFLTRLRRTRDPLLADRDTESKKR
jgi:uncharacterized membrane protein YfcA